MKKGDKFHRYRRNVKRERWLHNMLTQVRFWDAPQKIDPRAYPWKWEGWEKGSETYCATNNYMLIKPWAVYFSKVEMSLWFPLYHPSLTFPDCTERPCNLPVGSPVNNQTIIVNFPLRLCRLLGHRLSKHHSLSTVVLLRTTVTWSQLFERWIALSTGYITIHWITQLVFLIRINWIVIYPVDSAIQGLNNRGLDDTFPPTDP